MIIIIITTILLIIKNLNPVIIIIPGKDIILTIPKHIIKTIKKEEMKATLIKH